MRAWIQVAALALPAAALAYAQQETAPAAEAEPPAEERAGHEEAPKYLVLDGEVVGELVPAQEGDLCLVEQDEMHAGDPVYLVEGQRVAVHFPQCYKVLAADPQKYLGRLKPRGAFLAAGQENPALSNFWFFLGFYVVLGLMFASLSAHQALHAGRNPFAWFGVGMALSAVGYIILLTRPKLAVVAPAGVPDGLGKVATTYPPSTCPCCGAANHPCASQCNRCAERLEPRITSEVERAGPPTA
ncbi:MAG: hypothetical protein ACE5HB_07425 [Terriglobia bacterium]